MASSSKLSDAVPVSTTGAPAALPPDALFEILLRLPAKDLCRLRAVCRSWHALTSDPHFAAVHKSRHAEPLFAITFSDGDDEDDDYGVAIVSLSGQIGRRIPFGGDQVPRWIRIDSDCIELLPSHLDRICVFSVCKQGLAPWVLNPGTGVAIAGCVSGFMDNCRRVTHAFGQVASTRDYKLLRISYLVHPQSQLCDIITMDGSSQGRWRRKENPPSGLFRSELMEFVAVNGVVYFLFQYGVKNKVMEPASIVAFNLDTEKWMPTLRGPEPLRSGDYRFSMRQILLANVNDSLVMIDNAFGFSADLWFLMDQERCLWVKKYRLSIRQDCFCARPLLILEDGRIVIYEVDKQLLQCYDPTTDSLTDVLDIKDTGLGDSQGIAVYTGSLLI